MAKQTTKKKGRAAGNEATHTQTKPDSARDWSAIQVAQLKLADRAGIKVANTPCVCQVHAGGQCLTCPHWPRAHRMSAALRRAAGRAGR